MLDSTPLSPNKLNTDTYLKPLEATDATSSTDPKSGEFADPSRDFWKPTIGTVLLIIVALAVNLHDLIVMMTTPMTVAMTRTVRMTSW